MKKTLGILVGTVFVWFAVGTTAFAWEVVCNYTYNRNLNNVHISDVKVYRQGTNYLLEAKITTPYCLNGSMPQGYVQAKVNFQGGGSIDTGRVGFSGNGKVQYASFKALNYTHKRLYCANVHIDANGWCP